MIINNRDRVIFLKRLFFLVSLIIAISALIFFLSDYTIYGIAVVGLFALWFLFFQVADYQYIEFNNEGGKILLRYYKAVSLGKTRFNSIEFPQNLFHNAHFENSVFGKMTDMTLTIKTRRGIAEYPSVSLTALPPNDRRALQGALNQLSGI